MNQDNKELKQIIATLDCGNLELAQQLMDDLKLKIEKNIYNRTELEPEIGIVESSIQMGYGNYDNALSILINSMQVEPNNYELYYSAAMCFEQQGYEEKAYFYYKMAIFLGRDSQDLDLMQEHFKEFCTYADADAYRLERSCKALVEHRLLLKEYQKTYEFLAELLYDRNRVAAKTVISEANMLLLMMLEIVLCEKNHMNQEQFASNNTCVMYHNDVSEFERVYVEIKFVIRRIWFGIEIEDQKDIIAICQKYQVSGDMLAVIAKYSVKEELWQEIYNRLSLLLHDSDKQLSMMMQEYAETLKVQNIGTGEQILDPLVYDNGAKVYQIDCNSELSQQIISNDSNYITIIYCTNDKLYSDECNRYLRRLILPKGYQLRIIQVWNAKGMAAGYNRAKELSGDGIKIYIHHDSFIIARDLLVRIKDTFDTNSEIGMLGIAGTLKLPEDGYWWRSNHDDIRMNVYQDAVLNIVRSFSIKKYGEYEDAAAMDGILLATSCDVKWREDLFDGWHFYDISQCYEMRKAGKRVCVLNSDHYNMMHETTMRKDPNNLYEKYCARFLTTYHEYL